MVCLEGRIKNGGWILLHWFVEGFASQLEVGKVAEVVCRLNFFSLQTIAEAV